VTKRRRRAAGRPERANDVKLSRGGIREIEFIVQLMLVVRGGQFPEIRTRSTLKGLDKLAAGGLMKAATAQRLAEAYIFLRRVEHRIQFLDDQQTHILPTADADLKWVARSPADRGLRRCLRAAESPRRTREFVATEFDALLHDGQAPQRGPSGCRSCGPHCSRSMRSAFQDHLPEALAARVKPWVDNPKIRRCATTARCAWPG